MFCIHIKSMLENLVHSNPKGWVSSPLAQEC